LAAHSLFDEDDLQSLFVFGLGGHVAGDIGLVVEDFGRQLGDEGLEL